MYKKINLSKEDYLIDYHRNTKWEVAVVVLDTLETIRYKIIWKIIEDWASIKFIWKKIEEKKEF